MSGFALRDGLSFCRPDGRIVFLDIEADRYFGLSPELDRAFAALADHGTFDDDAGVALIRTGIITPSPSAVRPQPCARVGPPDRGIELRNGRASPIDIGRALLLRAIWRRRLRKKPLASNLAAIARRKSASTAKPPSHKMLARIGLAYQRAALLSSARDQCLATSLSLASWLLTAGFRPDLVLGVKCDPFQAHSWVEIDGRIIGDDPENARPFCPIRTI
jgi:hypothetical protein